MKVVIVTSGQPSLNPRLVKEADALCESGYVVTVLYQYWNEWGTREDIELLKNKQWKAIRIGGSPKEQKITYWSRKILQKIFSFLIKNGFSYGIVEWYLNSNWYLLYNEALRQRPNLIIGHNLGALASVVKSARKLNIKCGFDAEDFHRFEENDCLEDLKVKAKIYLENKYLPYLNYITTASPLISNSYKKLYPNLKFTTILNVFPIYKSLVKKDPYSESINLFWFSQTIGKNRGLEDIIRAMGILKAQPLILTLLGNLTNEMKTYLLNLINNVGLSESQIKFLQPVAPDEIFSICANHHIGLALEPGFSHNNNIALSNKIFTYLTAGLAVIATATDAQKKIMDENPGFGIVSSIGDSNEMANVLRNYLNDRTLLYHHQANALKLANNTFNWELEQEKFINLIKSTLAC